jgi:hypothetical protein
MSKDKTTQLFKRKGKLYLDRKWLTEANEAELRALFSEFYPMDANRSHNQHFWDSIEYYGVSKHFDEVDEGTVIPEYVAIIEHTEDEVPYLKEMVKKERYKIGIDPIVS